MTLVRICSVLVGRCRRWDGYLPRRRLGYDTPATGERLDGLGSPTGWCAEGVQGALIPLQPAGSLYRRVPGCPRANERRDPVCCPSILWRWLAVGDTLWQ